MLINIDDCKGLDMKLCQLAEEKQLTDEQFRYFTKGWQALWGMINELPSADRPQGEWVDSDGDTCFCSNCGAEAPIDKWEYKYRDKIRSERTEFCPDCGAPMKKK